MAETSQKKVGDQDDEHDDFRFHAMIAFAAVVILIGVPMWWTTTRVYRAALDYDKIVALSEAKITNYVEVTVLVVDQSASHSKLREIAILFQKLLPYRPDLSVHVQYTFEVRHLYQDEKFALDKVSSIEEADNVLHALKKDRRQTSILLIPSTSGLWRNSPRDAFPVLIGRHRNLFVRTQGDAATSVPDIANVLDDVIVERRVLEEAFHVSKGLQRQVKTGNLEEVKLSPVYDVTFTLLVPEPHKHHVTWDIASAISKFVEPFTQQLKGIIEFNIKSQVLYLLPLSIHPEKVTGSAGFKVTLDHLSQVINPVEAKLGSHVSINPTLNFLVYIPLLEYSPLHIHSEGKQSLSNSVLIPGWGGLMIYNPHPGSNSTTLNMAAVMSRFISQLRSLLVLEDKEYASGVVISPLDNRSIHDWEVDCLQRKRTVQNMVVTSQTIHSLSLLLTEISNIVISDEVAEQVALSVSALENSHLYLESGDLQQAYSHSKLAYIAAEKAFFDPSMLALLYFPDGQKYAIYIPLFLPVGIPVLQSLPVLWRWCRSPRTPHVKSD